MTAVEFNCFSIIGYLRHFSSRINLRIALFPGKSLHSGIEVLYLLDAITRRCQRFKLSGRGLICHSYVLLLIDSVIMMNATPHSFLVICIEFNMTLHDSMYDLATTRLCIIGRRLKKAKVIDAITFTISG